MYKSKYDAKSVFECFAGRVECDKQGKINSKLEIWAGKNGQKERHNFQYQYDAKGRLTKVYKNGSCVESYSYNHEGQRIYDGVLDEHYSYSHHGYLCEAGALVMRYNDAGQLVSRVNNNRSLNIHKLWEKNPRLVSAIHQWGRISFTYEGQRLVQAVLPAMWRIRYEYKRNSVMPTHIYHDNRLAWECEWCDAMRPLHLVDVMQGISYKWIYDKPNDALPIRIFVEGRKLSELGITSGVWGANKESFLVAYDQVGTLRALINSHGKIVKRIDYDSFGNVLYDSLPEFFIPQGFAAGMTDPFTGLVKFGYRYYDPQVGRFIAKDPANDMRGDGDLYDYCVDDPIGRVDRDGRFWGLALRGATAIAGGLGIGGVGALGSAGVADAIESYRTGERSTNAFDAVFEVAPMVGSTVLGTKAVALAPSLTQSAGEALVPFYINNKLLIDGAADVASGAFGQFGTSTTSIWGAGGTAAGLGYDIWQNKK